MPHYYLHMQSCGDIEFDADHWAAPTPDAIAAARAHIEPHSQLPHPVIIQTPFCDVNLADIVDVTVTA